MVTAMQHEPTVHDYVFSVTQPEVYLGSCHHIWLGDLCTDPYNQTVIYQTRMLTAHVIHNTHIITSAMIIYYCSH